MTFFFIISACFAFLALSPYYRYTALVMAAVYLFYALIEPFTYIESGLIYALYVVLDVLAVWMILRWGDEGKLRLCTLFACMVFLNALSVFDYYLVWELQQGIFSWIISLLAIAQVGALTDGFGDSIRVFGRFLHRIAGNLYHSVRNIRTDP